MKKLKKFDWNQETNPHLFDLVTKCRMNIQDFGAGGWVVYFLGSTHPSIDGATEEEAKANFEIWRNQHVSGWFEKEAVTFWHKGVRYECSLAVGGGLNVESGSNGVVQSSSSKMTLDFFKTKFGLANYASVMNSLFV